MDINDFRILLEKTDNKLEIFGDKTIICQYDLSFKEFYDLISEFLTDQEIFKLFEYEHIRNLSWIRKIGLINRIHDKNILFQILEDDTILSGFQEYEIINIVKRLDDEGKEKLLNKEEWLRKYKIRKKDISNIIKSLGDEKKFSILSNKGLIINELHLSNEEISNLVRDSIKSEEEKKQLVDIYEFTQFQKTEIAQTYSDSSKKEIILQEADLKKDNKILIMKTMEVSSLISLINEYKKEVFTNIRPYEIISKLDTEKQLEFMNHFSNLNLTEDEKKEILIMLSTEAKKKIDTSSLSEELKKVLDIKTEEDSGKIVLDLDRNLEDYYGLDNLLSVNPEEFNDEQRKKFIKLCDICPNLKVISTIGEGSLFYSTTTEYKLAEKWIESVLVTLKPEYTKAQKTAIIDNAIGKKISYSPDFNTEVFNNKDCRALYKIISSGYGVCNGIARLEKYMLERVGIKCEIISGKGHAFLKLINMEFTLANGEKVVGTTILDPTWNLSEHRFNGIPNNFCISYEEARKRDIDAKGNDHECHKNDEELKDATFNLDEQSLRELFKSVKLANKDGNFPVDSLLRRSEESHQMFKNNQAENIKNQFLLLKQVCPEFTTCQNSTIAILSKLVENENLKLNKCIVNRVYKRSDDEKEAVVYVYIESDELGKKFYYADKNTGVFIELLPNEFISEFECYAIDLKNNNGIRPWENSEPKKQIVDLERSSGRK